MIRATSLLSLATLFIRDNITNDFTGWKPTSSRDGYFYLYPTGETNEEPQLVNYDSNSANFTYFPKCCQPNFLYDPEDRQCVENRNVTPIHRELNVSVDLIKRGLYECVVVIDRFVEKSELKRSDGDVRLVIDGDETFAANRFCLDGIVGDERRYVVRLCREREYCWRGDGENVSNDWCVYKCCPDTSALQDNTCERIDKSGLRVKQNKEHYESVDGYGFLYGDNLRCAVANWLDFRQVNFVIKTDGHLLQQDDPRIYEVDEYCLDTRYNTKDKNYVDILIICEFNRILYAKWTILRALVISSCVCFAATIIVYVFVYKLKKLVEQVIACFCSIDLIFWILYAMRIFYVPFRDYCTAFGYFYYFVMLSRLTWLNVLSYEIWNTLGKVRAKVGETRQILRKKFLYYCLYATILPLICTALFILADKEFYPLPASIKPYINPAGCALDTTKIGNYGHYLYLYLPISILIIINVVFYTKTVAHFLKVKNDLNKISDSTKGRKQKEKKNNNKQGFIILKLGLVMGITWIYYIYDYLSKFEDVAFLLVIGDILRFSNVLEGLYFLIIFVFKWKTLKEIPYRLGILKKATIISPAVSTTSTACTIVDSNESLSGMAMESTTKEEG